MPVQIFFPYFDPYSWIPHIQIDLGTKYQVKSIILNFWTSSTQKECFRSKEEKNEDCHRILHIRISLGFKSEFQQFWFFWSKAPPQKKKKIYIYISSWKHTKWTSALNSSYLNSLKTRFQLNLLNTHTQTNFSANSWGIVWVCLTILWGWLSKG